MILGSIFIIEYKNENKALKFEVTFDLLFCCYCSVMILHSKTAKFIRSRGIASKT